MLVPNGQWEYRIEAIMTFAPAGLKQLGEERWELVEVSPIGGWIFKRPKLVEVTDTIPPRSSSAVPNRVLAYGTTLPNPGLVNNA